MILKLKKQLQSILGLSDKVYFHHRVDQYRDIWRAVARNNDASFSELAIDLWEITRGEYSFRVMNHELELDNPVTLNLAGNKPQVHKMLQCNGLEVPEYVIFDLQSVILACNFLDKHGNGCVIKPAKGTAAGDGVTTHVTSHREIRNASLLASLYCQELLIEPQIPGECYRLLVMNGTMVHAVCRRGPRLIGDGISTIKTLISNENRTLQPSAKRNIVIDADCIFTLAWQELSLNTVAKQNQEFIVKTVHDERQKLTEIRTVYDTVVTDDICVEIIESAESAANILKSVFVGVDIICTDPSRSLKETGGVINELNTTPALHHHYDSSNEPYPPPAQIAFDMLMDRARISKDLLRTQK